MRAYFLKQEWHPEKSYEEIFLKKRMTPWKIAREYFSKQDWHPEKLWVHISQNKNDTLNKIVREYFSKHQTRLTPQTKSSWHFPYNNKLDSLSKSFIWTHFLSCKSENHLLLKFAIYWNPSYSFMVDIIRFSYSHLPKLASFTFSNIHISLPMMDFIYWTVF